MCLTNGTLEKRLFQGSERCRRRQRPQRKMNTEAQRTQKATEKGIKYGWKKHKQKLRHFQAPAGMSFSLLLPFPSQNLSLCISVPLCLCVRLSPWPLNLSSCPSYPKLYQRLIPKSPSSRVYYCTHKEANHGCTGSQFSQ